jgi:hypothetical protein
MERSKTHWILASALVGTIGLTACQNDKVAKDDVEKIVNDRLAEEEGKRLAAEHELLKEENLALKNEIEVLKEELTTAQTLLDAKKPMAATAAKKPGATTATKPAAQTSKEKQMADLRAKLRGGSGAK